MGRLDIEPIIFSKIDEIYLDAYNTLEKKANFIIISGLYRKITDEIFDFDFVFVFDGLIY